MSMHGGHTGAFSRYENDPAVYTFRDGNYDDRPVPFVSPPAMPPMRGSLPMSMTLRPPSPHFDDIDTSPSKKNSRYLREMDRRTILARLDRGEKQSALAKEFRVTRAAICNLNKHRDLVLSRQHEDPLAKHPKKAKRKHDSEDEAEAEDSEISIQDGSNRVSLLLSGESYQSDVHSVALQPAERLIPLLLSRDTTNAAFKRYCDRLMTMVVEEVLAWATRKPATTFKQLPTGHIKLSQQQVGSPVAVVVDLPASVASHSVCLFYAFTDAVGGVRVAKSIRELLNRGAVEELLCLVTLAVSAFTVGELQRAHPSMRIAAAHVESHDDLDDWHQYRENEAQNGAGKVPRSTSRLQLLANRVADIY
ncbi:hypothetical protein PF010_g5132 [Phytophthora fragariae]|uniref:HTH psq-type domain-containing protein n=1 Tax=Phytophthora fragariae TaxID=53985 RepID=A0A6G0PEN6_9STRA|nr:hypothetical protein PF010_g5132 [Phytophthora fragariae]KAE9244170.1 hypothetical protein PF004_g5798 [Phytophthora fragariae]